MTIESGRTVEPCLHLLLSASQSAWDDCARVLQKEDTVLFLADGVMRLLQDDEAVAIPQFQSRYSAADLAARGMLALARKRGMDVFEDEDLTGLLKRHRHCLSWK
jgi:sulfur relay protein TusB/DsrH